MAVNVTTGSITYEPTGGSNGLGVIRVMGCWHEDVVRAGKTLLANDGYRVETELVLHNDPALSQGVIGRQVWFADRDINTPEDQLMIRTLVLPNYKYHDVNYPFPDLNVTPGEKVCISWHPDDIVKAAEAGGWVNSDGLPVAERVGETTAGNGATGFVFRAHLYIGTSSDITTPSMLSFLDGSIDFGNDRNRPWDIQTYRRSIFQLGESYAGSPKRGANLRQIASHPNNCGSRFGGRWRLFASNVQVGTGYTFRDEGWSGGGGILSAKGVNFNSSRSDLGGSIIIRADGSEIEDTSLSQTLSRSRGFYFLFYNPPTSMKNVLFEHGGYLRTIQNGGVDMLLEDITIGENAGTSDTSYTIQKGIYSGSNTLTLKNLVGELPENIAYFNSGGVLSTIEVVQNYKVSAIDKQATPLENVLTHFTDATGGTAQSFLTDATGSSGDINLPVFRRTIDNGAVNVIDYQFNPFSAKYLKYGYDPVVLTKDFNEGSISDNLIMYLDSAISLTDVEAAAITGVSIQTGSFTDPNGNIYSYKIDCGNNTLSDVYHNLAYRVAQDDANDTDAVLLKNTDPRPLNTSDGSSFYGAQGFLFENFLGNVDFTIADDGTVYTPEQLIHFKLSNLIVGTEVRIYEAGTGNELTGVENVETNEFSYFYSYAGSLIPVYVVIFKENYQPIRLEINLGGDNSDIPISQIFDRVYKTYDLTYITTPSETATPSEFLVPWEA